MRTRAASTVLLAFFTALGVACHRQAPQTQSAKTGPAPTPPAATQAQNDDGQWLMAAKDYANTRFSGLTEITPQNVSNLKLTWSFSTGVLRGQEAAPLVVGSTMYIVTPYPNILYALDLSKPGAPMKWSFRPKPSAASQGVACCDVVNRGAAYADGKIFFNTLDNHTIAVDATTGQQVWNATVGDINRGETLTMAPIVVKGKVLVGNSGGEFGIRGWVTALNASDGSMAWRAYHTGPDKDVLIGPLQAVLRLGPRHRSRRLELAARPVEDRRRRDVGLDLVRPGDRLDFLWHRQPGTVESRAAARRQQVGVHAVCAPAGDRRGGVGVPVQPARSVRPRQHQRTPRARSPDQRRDAQGARPPRAERAHVRDRSPDRRSDLRRAVRIHKHQHRRGSQDRAAAVRQRQGTRHRPRGANICPPEPGAKDWQPSAYSPRTGMLYFGHQNLCEDMEGLEVSYIEGTPYVGTNVKMYAGPGGHRGEFKAWDPVGAHAVWSIKENFPVWSGTVVTAGDVAFYGTMDGWFKAVNARTGDQLWQFKVRSGIIGQPISYKGPDGKQYIAVLSGVGGWAGAIVAGNLDPKDPTAALGFVNAMADLPSATTKGGTLYVFSLP